MYKKWLDVPEKDKNTVQQYIHVKCLFCLKSDIQAESVRIQRHHPPLR